MKRIKFFSVLAVVSLGVLACSTDPDYDLTEGIRNEMTIFKDSLSLPVGNLKVFQLKDVLKPSDLEILKVSEKGDYYVADDGDSIWSLPCAALPIYDKGDPDGVTVTLEDESGWESGRFAIISLIGGYVGQVVEITFKNPFDVPLNVNGTVYVEFIDWDTLEFPTGNIEVKPHSEEVIYHVPTGEFESYMPVSVGVSDFDINIPREAVDDILEYLDKKIALGFNMLSMLYLRPGLTLKPEIEKRFNVDIAKYKMKELELRFNIVNSLPLDVTINNIHFLDSHGQVIEGVHVVSGEGLSGGSMLQPVERPAKVKIVSDTFVPDLYGIKLNGTLTSSEGGVGDPLNVNTSLTLENIIATLRGGITL